MSSPAGETLLVPKVTFRVLTAWMGNPGAVVARTVAFNEAKSKPKLNTLELNMVMRSADVPGVSTTFLGASYVRSSGQLADAQGGVLLVLYLVSVSLVHTTQLRAVQLTEYFD
jgi:hypothetical protein